MQVVLQAVCAIHDLADGYTQTLPQSLLQQGRDHDKRSPCARDPMEGISLADSQFSGYKSAHLHTPSKHSSGDRNKTKNQGGIHRASSRQANVPPDPIMKPTPCHRLLAPVIPRSFTLPLRRISVFAPSQPERAEPLHTCFTAVSSRIAMQAHNSFTPRGLICRDFTFAVRAREVTQWGLTMISPPCPKTPLSH